MTTKYPEHLETIFNKTSEELSILFDFIIPFGTSCDVRMYSSKYEIPIEILERIRREYVDCDEVESARELARKRILYSLVSDYRKCLLG